MPPYLQANAARDENVNSLHIVKNYGFLRISQFSDIEAVETELGKL